MSRALRAVLTVICSALLLAAAAHALSGRAADRRKQLDAEAAAQRAKLGLQFDRAKLYALYPTPEVTFESEPVHLAPGATAALKLSGRFPPGTSFLLNTDGVELLSPKQTASTFTAQARASKDALPGLVRLIAKSPVSGAEQSVAVLKVQGRYDLELAFADGWHARLRTTELDDNGNLTLDAVWTKPGDKRSPRKNQVTLEGREEGLEGEIHPTEDDVATLGIADDLAAAQNPPSEELQKLSQQAMEKAMACQKLASEAQEECTTKAMAPLKAAGDRMQKSMEATRSRIAAKTAAFACETLRLKGTAAALEVTARCLGDKTLSGTGTAHAVGP